MTVPDRGGQVDAALKAHYDAIARTGDPTKTGQDFLLRDLEIETTMRYLADGLALLDVGCGLGYALEQYLTRFALRAAGIDYSDLMIEGARTALQRSTGLRGRADLRVASVLSLPFEGASFDRITSHRCLMALLDWERQKEALVELHRVLVPGGILCLFEGTVQGLHRLNAARRRFGLPDISADTRPMATLKLDEPSLLEAIAPLYDLVEIKRFGMYYFISRVIHPLLVAPDLPRFDARINRIAFEIARQIPDYDGLGHLVGFILRKRDAR
jgi:ubiquinone/menaquinone biosynthesis C-methylase UbiE